MPLHSQYSPRYSTRIKVATLAMCASAVAFADNSLPSRSTLERLIDTANPYARLTYTHDSNLFYLADETPSTDGRADRYTTITAGFDSTLTASRQKIALSGNIYRDKYDTYKDLDNTGGNANATWNWSAGNMFTGTAGYQYKQLLHNFSNRTGDRQNKDIQSEDTYLASMTVDLPRNWQATVSGSLSDISFSTIKSLDLTRLTGGAALNYVSHAGNIVGLDAKIINGDYDINHSRNFDEYRIGPTLEWQLTTGLRLSGRIGYTKHNMATPSEPDYDDITGRIVLRERAANEDQLTLTIWRELSNLGDEIADFTLINGVKIEPQWQISEVLTLRMSASYENRDFKSVGADANRQDDIYTGSVFTDWTVTRNITISLGFDAGKRSSTRDFQDYDFRNIQLQIKGQL